jgi:HEAT repeat protein
MRNLLRSFRPAARLRTFRWAAVCFLLLASLDARPVFSAQAPPPTVLDRLKSPSPAVRRRAASDLGKSKRPDALTHLADLVRDPDTDVRIAVLRAIASLREIAGVPAMLVFMSDAEPKVRSESIDGVVEIYTHRDRPGVTRFLAIFSDSRDKPEPLVVAAVDFEVYRSLAERLKDPEASLRESAAEAIGILGGTEVAVDLVAALSDPASGVRAAAVTSIIKVGTSADGEALTPVIRDSSAGVRRRAIEGLGRLRVVDAAPALRALFTRAPESDDGILALSALAQLALAQDRALFQRFVGLADPRTRKPSIEGLARLGDKNQEARFKRGFQREKTEELRATYAFGLFLLGDRPFLDTVILGFAGSKDRARQSRAYVEELGDRALPEALDYLHEPDSKIRIGLCDALANAGVTKAAAAIEPLTKDMDKDVAQSAARAMALLKNLR